MRLVEVVAPGDQAGQHAGIGRVQFARDQGEAHALERAHAEAAQHLDVRMARAHQHDILDDRARRTAHHRASVCGPAESRTGRSSILSRRLSPRESASIAIESAPVAAISTTATSRRSSAIAASTW